MNFAKGDIVHYHPIIGQPHDGKEYEIVDFGSINGDRDVCWLMGKRGCVSTRAISAARPRSASSAEGRSNG
jgi:hypothetical protein